MLCDPSGHCACAWKAHCPGEGKKGCASYVNPVKSAIKEVAKIIERTFYSSADDAATAFAQETYGATAFARHEYGAEIYSISFNGEKYIMYTTPRVGSPHRVSVGAKNIPKGATFLAYMHTHPNSNIFSGLGANETSGDIPVANSLGVNAYVVGPNLNLQRYNVSAGTVDVVGTISPIALTSTRRASLELMLTASWNSHLGTCNFDCEDMTWPTP